MPEYAYKALEGRGQRIRGLVSADSEAAVADVLIHRGLHPLEIKRKESWLSRLRSFHVRGLLRHRERALIARQLSDLLTSGMPVHSALRVIEKQSDSAVVKTAVSDIVRLIEDGQSLSGAMGALPRQFSQVHVSLVRAGESGGFLTQVLDQFAELEERADELKSRVRSALTYPGITAAVGFVTILIIINFVIPRLSVIFEEMGRSLPWTTRLLIFLGNLGHTTWIWLGAITVVAALAYGFLRRSTRWMLLKDTVLLRLPGLGGMLLDMNISTFAGTLGSLIRNGVPLVQAFQVSVDTLDNGKLRKELEPALADVNEGRGLGVSLESAGVLPRVVTGMISVGEETGHLEDTLQRISQSAFQKGERRMKTAVGLIEPGLIILLGLVVGFIVASIMLPIFQVDIGF